MTPRQQIILRAIVEHYVQTALPVSSLQLSRLFESSPATIRAEMAALEDYGYITHPHTSAGRVPTDKGYRQYVDGIHEPEKVQDQSRVQKAIDQRINAAGEPGQAIKSAVDSLVEVTRNLGMGTLGNNLYTTGLANLLTQPEFINPASIYEVARLLDNLEPWLRELHPAQRVSVYIGHESPIGKGSGCALIIARFASPYSDYSYIGIVGPTRQSYPEVIKLVDHVSRTLEGALS